MIQIVNQVRRIWSDDGRGDKDFSEAETNLREAEKKLFDATDLLKRASETLSVLLESKGLKH